ncbi:hypothetical protein INR49_015374 [Caranx melampygus]|nr:hypothetical protein INR49_015374 [Caranx melampygus]
MVLMYKRQTKGLQKKKRFGLLGEECSGGWVVSPVKEIVKYFGKSCASRKQGMVLNKGRDPESESYEDRKKSLSLVSHLYIEGPMLPDSTSVLNEQEETVTGAFFVFVPDANMSMNEATEHGNPHTPRKTNTHTDQTPHSSPLQATGDAQMPLG